MAHFSKIKNMQVFLWFFKAISLKLANSYSNWTAKYSAFYYQIWVDHGPFSHLFSVYVIFTNQLETIV